MSESFLKIRKGIKFFGATSDPADAEEGDVIFRSDLTPPRFREYRNSAWADVQNSRFFNMVRTTDSTTTGSNATLASFSTPFINLTNASLVSVDMIPAGEDGQIIVVSNNTERPYFSATIPGRRRQIEFAPAI
jgi:hypothetical protein